MLLVLLVLLVLSLADRVDGDRAVRGGMRCSIRRTTSTSSQSATAGCHARWGWSSASRSPVGRIDPGAHRNPADPGILGVHAGASFAVTVAVGLLGVRDVPGFMGFAFAGHWSSRCWCSPSGQRGRVPRPCSWCSPGSASARCLGASGAIQLTELGRLRRASVVERRFDPGSTTGGGVPILPFFAVALVLAFVVAGPLDAMALGDELAVAQGVRMARTRVLAIIALTLLAGGATAIAGPIGFVGLMVPHVARWIVGPHQRWIFAYSILLAPGLLLVSDILGRIVMRPGEIPVGIVTAFVGAPVLIVLVRRRKASVL